nr:protein kinase-like domain, phloem protein 2-like protein [Tanacetum cinerariifolium]
MTEDESKSANDLFVEKKGILQKIAEASKETLQDQLFIKNWILMTTRILFQQILMTAVDESDSEQEEEEDDQFSLHAFMFHPGPPTKIAKMVQTVGSWKPNKEFPSQSKECDHDWKENMVTNYIICYYCGILTTDMSRLNYPKCQLTTCTLCAKKYLGKTVNVKGKQPQKPKEEKDFSSNEVKLLKELLKEKTKQVQQMIRDQAKEYHENKIAMQKKEELWQSKESLLIKDLTDALKIIEQPKTEQIRHEERKDEKIRELNLKVRKITNQLYDVKVEFDIPDCPTFGTTAIIDRGASACCINKKVIPEEALEPLTQIVFFNGLNSRQHATHRIKSMKGGIRIERDEITIYKKEANFLRSMKGGIRIEGDEITIYKKVTRIKTSNQTKVTKIAELEVWLKHQGYIRKEPLKHWKKNGELCKLDIINPDIIIEDRPLKHVTPAMEDSFRKHVDSLLKICAIRPECIGEMKQLAAAALYSVEEVLQSTYAFQKNIKITYEETCLTKEKTLEFKTKKLEESSLNWKPLYNDCAATTSKPNEVQAYNSKDNKCHYSRKGFLEDDDSSDGSIFIVDPRWNDYFLQELKLNRRISCCPDARRTCRLQINAEADGHTTIVAKRWNSKSGSGDHQFWTELDILFNRKHENIIGLVGYCNEMNETIIVYKHASNGILDKHLDNASLTWMKRLRICINIASGLVVLHGGDVTRKKMVHGGIKSASILLTADWKAQISDLEFSSDSLHEHKEHTSDNAYGTFAWSEGCEDHSRSIVPLAKCSHKEGKIDEMVFRDIKKQIVPQSLTTFAKISYECVSDDGFDRPEASEVVIRLKEALTFQWFSYENTMSRKWRSPGRS